MLSRHSAVALLCALVLVLNCLILGRSVLHAATHTRHVRGVFSATHILARRHAPSAPVVALTFDDGPNPYYTDQVLAILRQFAIHATFFIVGRQAASFPDLVRAEAAGGNEVENHTWSHADLLHLSLLDGSAQIAGTADEVLLLTGRAPRYLRPPYGHVDRNVRSEAQALGEQTVLWNVDPRDWALPGTWYIQTNILANTRNRSIILMHDGGGRRDETLAALRTVIPALQARGFQFVTMQQLMDPLIPSYIHIPPIHTSGMPGSTSS